MEILILSLIFGSLIGIVLSTFFQSKPIGIATCLAILLTVILVLKQS